MSTDVSALQLLPEIQSSRSTGGDLMIIAPTCFEPTCILTYCPVPQTVIG